MSPGRRAMSAPHISTSPERRYSNGELVKRLLALAWQFRGDCLLSLLLSLALLLLGLLGLQLLGVSIDVIRQALDPRQRMPVYPLGWSPPPGWPPLHIVTALSLAIVLQEQIQALQADCKTQIYATDLDAQAIDSARRGFYSDGSLENVSAERLQTFFQQEEEGYQIKKAIRDQVVFSTQNVISDPAFSKIDLVSCRNVLIYLERELQNQLFLQFHYSLNPEGILFLGNSESVGGVSDLFTVVDRKHKIFRRKQTSKPRLIRTKTSIFPREAVFLRQVRLVVERLVVLEHEDRNLRGRQGQLVDHHGHIQGGSFFIGRGKGSQDGFCIPNLGDDGGIVFIQVFGKVPLSLVFGQENLRPGRCFSVSTCHVGRSTKRNGLWEQLSAPARAYPRRLNL